MKELWEQALIGYNLPLTVLLGLVVLFWLITLLGIFDLDALDVDLDIDADADLNGVEGVGGNILGVFLKFVNAQDVPLMIVLSLLSLSLWALSIVSNYYFNPSQSIGLAMAFLAGNLFLSAFLVKVITHPLRPFMRNLKNDQELQQPLVGMSGVVKSRVLDSNFGQVEVPREKGAPALLNAILPEGKDALVRGNKILVIDFDEKLNKYLVQAASSESSLDT